MEGQAGWSSFGTAGLVAARTETDEKDKDMAAIETIRMRGRVTVPSRPRIEVEKSQQLATFRRILERLQKPHTDGSDREAAIPDSWARGL